MDRLNIPKSGSKILHFAPEQGLGRWLRSECPDGYEAVDFTPSLYPNLGTKKFDLISDSPSLPTDAYDMIVHSHVLEHVPINISFILFHLNRALKPDGLHIFSLPLMSGHYDEFFGPMKPEDATARFGQFDHIRKFGREDIDRHLGCIVKLPKHYDLYEIFSKEEMDSVNIPESERKGFHGSTVFTLRKSDYLLA